jgi:hypothetical protein
VRTKTIAISPAAFPVVENAPATRLAGARSDRRRRISTEAGHALEKLGHAIDYLTDEYIHEGGTFNRHDAKLQAVEMLMAINREIYFACPEVPTMGDRWYAWLHGHRH